MKKITVMILVLFLSGCAYQTIDGAEIERSQHICSERGGVYEISSTFLGDEVVICKDGHRQNVWVK